MRSWYPGWMKRRVAPERFRDAPSQAASSVRRLVVPYVFVFAARPGILPELAGYGGERGVGAGFNLQAFGAALTVGIALITQMGEQADYLRFMPEKTAANARRWWWTAGNLLNTALPTSYYDRMGVPKLAV